MGLEAAYVKVVRTVNQVALAKVAIRSAAVNAGLVDGREEEL